MTTPSPPCSPCKLRLIPVPQRVWTCRHIHYSCMPVCLSPMPKRGRGMKFTPVRARLARRVICPSRNQTPRVGVVEEFRDSRPSQESTAADAVTAAVPSVVTRAPVAFLEFHPTRPTLLTIRDRHQAETMYTLMYYSNMRHGRFTPRV